MNRREALRSFAVLALAAVTAPLVPTLGEQRAAGARVLRASNIRLFFGGVEIPMFGRGSGHLARIG